jgi:ketosteroid isomerase-like protein
MLGSESLEPSKAAQVLPAPGVPAVVLAYFDAINHENLDRLGELWAEHSELRAVGIRARHGREQVMNYFSGLFEPWRAHADTPTRFIVASDTIVTEITFTGTTQAGKSLTFDALDVFDLMDGRISRLTTWYDLAWVRKQL